MRSKEHLGMHVRARKRSISIDIPLLLAMLILIGIGCFFIYDFTVISPAVPSKNYYLMRQLMFAILGCCSLMIISKIDYHFLYQMVIPLLVCIIILLLCTHAVGSTSFIYWQAPHLFVGKIGIDVTQLTEVVVPLSLAQLMSRIDLRERKRSLLMIYALFVCFLPMIAFNIKSTLVLLMILYCLLFLADAKASITIFVSVASLMTVLQLYLLRQPEFETFMHNKSILAWQDPFSDFYGHGSAAAQSIYAVANGGLLGVGVGRGMMRYAVEDVHSEFVLPAITEEIGLIGAVLILLAYLFLLMRMFTIAVRATDRWGFYLASAIIVRYIVHFVFYLLVRTNLIPQLSDLSLPFISYGGSSLMTDCLMVGILFSIRRYQIESGREVRT